MESKYLMAIIKIPVEIFKNGKTQKLREFDT
jgi:hypothetical protein